MTAIVVPNIFLPSTTISSTAMNANFEAVADSLEASLALDGSETMIGQIRGANGTAAAPAFSFGTDLNIGMYRKTTDELAFSTNGTLAMWLDVGQKGWFAGAVDIAGALDVGGALGVDGAAVILGTLDLGAATDTTLARSSAGNVTIEGNIIYRAGGTDVAIADGGTGQGTAADAFTALKQAASDTASGVLEIADQTEMEAASSTLLAVTPGRLQYHPGAAKFWAKVTYSGGTPSLVASHNVTSISDIGTGQVRFTIGTDFSSANWALLATANGAGNAIIAEGGNQAAGTVDVFIANNGGASIDVDFFACGFGDQ